SNGRTVGMLGRLGKFATLYSKKALAGYNLSTVEEWIYLLRLYMLDNPKKSELIYGLISEFPSGSEIIKRLKRKGFVSEYIDPSDRRSKRLKISGKGKKLLRDSMPKMEIVGEMALNRLNEDEKIVLDYLLNKLDAFHTRNYKKVHKASFKEAYSTILEDLDKSSEGSTR
ncbi:MAG: winged helix-turn-helix transcriptional regulator, partial [Saprospiraceae bacterium]|nr:winged helix-turn-helix transcriptional regulator [Saprospiraceae bacterium]